MKLGILIYEDAEVLDYAGPFEVFSTANRIIGKAFFEPVLLSQHGGLVKTRGGLEVNTAGIETVEQLDMLIVSGGVHTNVVGNPVIEKWVKHISSQVTYLVSICTGVFLLASSGCLTKGKVTTHWEDQHDLHESYPALEVLPNVRWVQQENIFTSGGIAAGIDVSLHLVSIIQDVTVARNTAKQMEVIWQDN